MAILSASNLIRFHALFVLLPLAYCFTFAPDLVSSSTFVWSLGEALQIPDRTADSNVTSPVIALGLIVAAATQIMLRPQPILGQSKYNVFSFCSAHYLTNAWSALATALTGTFGFATLPIYAIAQTSEGGVWSVLADRTLFTACFLEFIIWFYINSALKEDVEELSNVGRERGEEWGLLGR